MVALAIRADYGRSRFFNEDDSLRLATATINRGDSFAQQMATVGHEIDFEVTAGGDSISEVDLDHLSLEEEQTLPTREHKDHPEIGDVMPDCPDIPVPLTQSILGWLKVVYRRSRGFEIGTFDSSLVVTMMNRQARKWRHLALGYVSDIITLVHSFVMEVLQHIIPGNRHVRDRLSSLLSDQLRSSYAAALKHTEFLVSVELEGTPATHNHYFKDTLDKR